MTRPALARVALFAVALPFAACECEGIEGANPNGSITPPLLDLGPIPLDTDCQAILKVENKGTADLRVEGSALANVDGNWLLQAVPQVVSLGGSDDIIVNYSATGPENERQSATVQLTTNHPDNDGVLTATITALPTSETAGVAIAKCGEGDARSTCNALEFGATQIGSPAQPPPGRSLQVDIVNEGNAPVVISAAVIDGGDGDFDVQAILLGNTVTTLPVTLAPGRAGACAPLGDSTCVDADSCNVLTLDVAYKPTALGGDAADLAVFTDAAEGSEIRVGLTGQGSDIGIVVIPDYVSFSGVDEGGTGSVDLRVINVGSREEPVNDTCIDLGGDGSCDGLCTGGDGEKVLGGTLGCDVTKVDGSNEGKGFVLGATDAQEGGNDERVLTVTWSPTSADPEIPGGTVVRLETNLSANDGVITVPVAGGNAGVLRVEADPSALCGSGLCVQAESATPEDTTTWTGSVDFTLTNEGDGTLDVTSIGFDDSQPTVADDFALEDNTGAAVNPTSPGISLAPGGSVDLTILYANNDASQVDIVNLDIVHTGLGGELTVPVNAVPPE